MDPIAFLYGVRRHKSPLRDDRNGVRSNCLGLRLALVVSEGVWPRARRNGTRSGSALGTQLPSLLQVAQSVL